MIKPPAWLVPSLVGSLALVSFPAAAGGIDLALGDETANISVLLNAQHISEGEGSELAVGGFINENGDSLVHASLMARGRSQLPRSQYLLAAGIKLIGGDIEVDGERRFGEDVSGGEENQRVGAVALGFEAGLLLAPSRNPIEVSVEGFIAPSITSFSDAERFSELVARLQVEIIPQARAYIGYRRMRFDTDAYDSLRVDDSAHVGLKIDF